MRSSKSGLDCFHANSKEAFRKRIEFLFGTMEMKRPLDVLHGLAGIEGGGRRRGFQLIKWPQRRFTWFGRTVVVGIDHIAGVRFLL